MSCPCSKVNTSLICNFCQNILVIRHKESENPIEVAIRQSRKCKNCYSQDFTIKD